MDGEVRNRVEEVRKGRGLGAAELARRVGVSRQTIYAIEAGTYVPNTGVTLRLARELEVLVEALFVLESPAAEEREALACEVLSPSAVGKGQAVRAARVWGRLVSVPVSGAPYYLPEADGVMAKVGRGAAMSVLGGEQEWEKRLVVAGCDPGMGLLGKEVEMVVAGASSRLALEWMRAGKVHIAGSHLEDGETGEFNVPYLRREFPGEQFAVVTFACWEEGMVVRAGNPLGVREVSDLTRLRFVNREEGSGSRGLVDRLLREAGVKSGRVAGYERVAYGHLAAAYAVQAGESDCCVATRSAARTFGLDFIALRRERYDFVMKLETLALPGVQAFLEALQRGSLRRKLEVLAGYETGETGVRVV